MDITLICNVNFTDSLTNNKFLQYYKTFLFTLFICVNILVVLSGERKALVLLLIFDFHNNNF